MSAEVDAWVLSRRPAREQRNAYLPYEYFVEEECAAGGAVEPVATIFLTNRECPLRCAMSTCGAIRSERRSQQARSRLRSIMRSENSRRQNS